VGGWEGIHPPAQGLPRVVITRRRLLRCAIAASWDVATVARALRTSVPRLWARIGELGTEGGERARAGGRCHPNPHHHVAWQVAWCDEGVHSLKSSVPCEWVVISSEVFQKSSRRT
jgi:hypothetical protein